MNILLLHMFQFANLIKDTCYLYKHSLTFRTGRNQEVAGRNQEVAGRNQEVVQNRRKTLIFKVFGAKIESSIS